MNVPGAQLVKTKTLQGDGIMAKEQRGLQPLLDSLNRAVDEGAAKEIDMQEMDRKLFGRALNLTGKVKFHMEPFKKAEGKQ